jgi:hypothetical protein
MQELIRNWFAQLGPHVQTSLTAPNCHEPSNDFVWTVDYDRSKLVLQRPVSWATIQEQISLVFGVMRNLAQTHTINDKG